MPAGTITLTNDSNIAKGSGTSFSAEFASGDVLASTVGEVTYTLFIKSVDSDTQVTLVKNYDGPTAAGLAWSAIPRNVAIAIPAQIATEVSKALRGLNHDKSNWQQVFSSSGTITVTLPDGSSFSGPSWQYMANMYSLKADLVDGAVDVAQGGTGSTTAAGARTSLGLKTAATADILGTVTQDSGVPTGAIIESGSNSTGNYTRYADGTMITTQILTTSDLSNTSINVSNSLGGYRTSQNLFALPATFVSPGAFLTGHCQNNGLGIRAEFVSGVLNSGQVSIHSTSASGTVPVGQQIYVIALGRWF